MAEGRRIMWDKEDKLMYDGLRNSSTPLKKLQLAELFAIALIYGKKVGFRSVLNDDATGRIRESTMNSSDIRYLMMAIAADEFKSIDILSDEDEYFRTCEEYAKTGIDLLNSDALEKNDQLLDDMETEILKFYEEVIEK